LPRQERGKEKSKKSNEQEREAGERDMKRREKTEKFEFNGHIYKNLLPRTLRYMKRERIA
jgi:hypothetical protein